jgi:hypothetical protein
MIANQNQAPEVVRIGVFVAGDGWLMIHPAVQGRFERREEALAAARRLAHLETWRGRMVGLVAQDPQDLRLASLDPSA